MEELLKNGVRPAAREPYGLEGPYNEKLDELLEDCVPIDGHEVLVASQVVPVCESKNKVKSLKRLAINYKSTINDHLEDIPHVHTSCNSELDKLKGEYRTCIDLKGDKVQNNCAFDFRNFELLYKNENPSCKFSFTKSTSSILKLCRKIIPVPYSLLYIHIFSDM